ncbi:MAG TPA: hypothetical protein DDX19_26405 [Rhodopirellula baltica]|uniref:Uncharacterized protein n=1 Tax=Rhodopirellula baltica (strain DSM 10527 / NCIMB 13988 / SH1) TaxID=243090 RepID=Q7UWX5_RHOBA|nr:hypothetical protein RB1726 [Rhodopirellula baltica SH 1]HBE66219.1 hypothetical protein [Rhodopirellula baltica]
MKFDCIDLTVSKSRKTDRFYGSQTPYRLACFQSHLRNPVLASHHSIRRRSTSAMAFAPYSPASAAANVKQVRGPETANLFMISPLFTSQTGDRSFTA